MKAWGVTDRHEGTGVIVFAETVGKARLAGKQSEYLEDVEWIDLSVKRIPAMDGEPRILKARDYFDAGWTYGCNECGDQAWDDETAVWIGDDIYHAGCAPKVRA